MACFNYYVQLVAIKRNWMPVPNLQLAKGGGEAGRGTGCMVILPPITLWFATLFLPLFAAVIVYRRRQHFAIHFIYI